MGWVKVYQFFFYFSELLAYLSQELGMETSQNIAFPGQKIQTSPYLLTGTYKF
jgi:hypothetical protein